MPAIYRAFATGTLSADLSNVGTTASSAAFANLPIVAAPDEMWLVLDPTGSAGTPEIVRVTAHSSAATTVTIVRAQQAASGGGAARAHLTGTTWVAAATPADFDQLPFRLVTARGDLVVGTGTNAVQRQAVGSNGQRLIADSAQPTGVRWAPDTELQLVDARGDLIAGTADNTVARLAVGTNQRILKANSAQPTGLEWGQLNDLGSFASPTLPVFVCTSSTRPGSPANGQVIFETDTNRVLQWYATPAVWRQPWNMPWGSIAVAPRDANQGSITTMTDLADMTATWTAVGNRRYLIRVVGQAISSVGSDVGGLVITTGSNTEVARNNIFLPSSGITSVGAWCETVVTPSAGSVTYKARLERVSGTGVLQWTASSTNPALFTVEDIGPANNTAA